MTSTLWGPTCDSMDKIASDVQLPNIEVGDWIIFKDMGAYTLPVASPFNGFPVPRVTAYITADLWLVKILFVFFLNIAEIVRHGNI